MANRYEEDYDSYKDSAIAGGLVSGFTTGASIGGSIGGALGIPGALIGGFIGGFIGGMIGIVKGDERKKEYRNQRELLMNDRMEATVNRNYLIQDAQRSISSFRQSFDSTYGEGMYDTYGELFGNIFNMSAEQMDVSSLLESLSIDTLSGDITTAVGGKLSEAALTGTLSAEDINAAYLEYMQEQIRSANTVIGMQFEAQSYRENSLVRDYYDSIDQYNMQVAQQFYNSFLQQREANISLEMAMGEASAQQANSGIRQIGGGAGSTEMQKFQKDLSDAAYYATLDYAIRSYQMQGESANNNLIDQIYGIRNENAIMTEQFTNDYFNSMNQYYGELINSFYRPIEDYEGSIEEINDEIRDINEVLRDKGSIYEEVDYIS